MSRGSFYCTYENKIKCWEKGTSQNRSIRRTTSSPPRRSHRSCHRQRDVWEGPRKTPPPTDIRPWSPSVPVTGRPGYPVTPGRHTPETRSSRLRGFVRGKVRRRHIPLFLGVICTGLSGSGTRTKFLTTTVVSLRNPTPAVP